MKNERARDACRHATCPLRWVRLSWRLARTAPVAPRSRRAVCARARHAHPVGKWLESVFAVSRFHDRLHFAEVVASEDGSRVTSAPWPSPPVPRALASARGGRSTGGRPSVSGTSWVLPAPFDTHDVPLVVTVVVMVAIGGRGGATARRDFGWGVAGRRWERCPRRLCSASIGAHGYGACLSRAWLQSRGGERAEAADGGGGDRARAVERVGVEGRARPWKGPAGRWVGTVAGGRVAGLRVRWLSLPSSGHVVRDDTTTRRCHGRPRRRPRRPRGHPRRA